MPGNTPIENNNTSMDIEIQDLIQRTVRISVTSASTTVACTLRMEMIDKAVLIFLVAFKFGITLSQELMINAKYND
jgi:hypothetical protein